MKANEVVGYLIQLQEKQSLDPEAEEQVQIVDLVCDPYLVEYRRLL